MATRVKHPWNEIRIAVVGGLVTMEEAAARWNVPLGSIKARSARKGWFGGKVETLIPGSKASGDQGIRVAEDAPAVADVLATRRNHELQMQVNGGNIATATREECKERIRNAAGRVVAKGLEGMVNADPDQIVAKADKIKALVDAGGKATGFGDDEKGGNTLVTLQFLKELPEVAPVIDVRAEPVLES